MFNTIYYTIITVLQIIEHMTNAGIHVCNTNFVWVQDNCKQYR